MKKSIAKNYMLDLSYRIICLLTPLLTAPYISRRIGVEGIGNYSYTFSVCSYFAMFAVLGSNIYGQREIARCNGNRLKISKTFWSIFILRFICVVFTACIYIRYCFATSGVIKVLLLLQTVDVVGQIFDITWLFQGMEEFGILLIRNLVMKGIAVGSIFLLVKSQEDLYIYVLMTSLANIIGNLTLFGSLKKYVDFVGITWNDICKNIIPIIRLFIPTVALNVYNQIDKTMIGALCSSNETGAYEQATKIIIIITTVVTSINNVMSPRMTGLFECGEKEKAKALLINSFNLIWLLSMPISMGLICISDIFVPIFFGNGYERTIILLIILSFVCMPMGIKTVIGMQYLIPLKNEKTYTHSIIWGLLVNVILNAILIPLLESVGAAIASLISEISIVLFLIYKLRKDIKLKEIMNGIFKTMIASMIMSVVVILIRNHISNDMISLGVCIFSGIIIYGIMLIFLKEELTLKILEKIKMLNA